MTRPLDEPGPDAMDAVLQFLPIVAGPDFHAGEMVAARESDGLTQPERFAMSEDMEHLVEALMEHGWVYEVDATFDWPEWQGVAERYIQSPALLDDAGIGTVRKLFTSHLRKEQFSPGHLGAIAKTGHFGREFVHGSLS